MMKYALSLEEATESRLDVQMVCKDVVVYVQGMCCERSTHRRDSSSENKEDLT